MNPRRNSAHDAAFRCAASSACPPIRHNCSTAGWRRRNPTTSAPPESCSQRWCTGAHSTGRRVTPWHWPVSSWGTMRRPATIGALSSTDVPMTRSRHGDWNGWTAQHRGRPQMRSRRTARSRPLVVAWTQDPGVEQRPIRRSLPDCQLVPSTAGSRPQRVVPFDPMSHQPRSRTIP